MQAARLRRGAIVLSMAKDDDNLQPLERAIAGALRSQIKDHGPITPEWIGSAVKRVLGNLKNAQPTGLASALIRHRWRGSTEEERAEGTAAAREVRWKGKTAAQRKASAPDGSAGGTKAWASMTSEERSAEMKRRAAVRAANRAKEKP